MAPKQILHFSHELIAKGLQFSTTVLMRNYLIRCSACLSNGYNSMAFWCEGTGPWQYVPPKRQEYHLPSPILEVMLLILGLFAVLMLVSWVWSNLGIKEKSRRGLLVLL